MASIPQRGLSCESGATYGACCFLDPRTCTWHSYKSDAFQVGYKLHVHSMLENLPACLVCAFVAVSMLLSFHYNCMRDALYSSLLANHLRVCSANAA